jgi:hypothetical protein
MFDFGTAPFNAPERPMTIVLFIVMTMGGIGTIQRVRMHFAG